MPRASGSAMPYEPVLSCGEHYLCLDIRGTILCHSTTGKELGQNLTKRMDPISIAAAVGTASSTAWRISLTLYTFISSAKKVDRSIDMLYTAFQGLETAIKNIETTLREPVVRTATTHRQDHDDLLLGIEQSIKDCQQTLDATDEQLSNVGPSSRNSSIWKKSLLQLNLNLADTEIKTLRLHIQSHCTSLQVALHSLTL